MALKRHSFTAELCGDAWWLQWNKETWVLSGMQAGESRAPRVIFLQVDSPLPSGLLCVQPACKKTHFSKSFSLHTAHFQTFHFFYTSFKEFSCSPFSSPYRAIFIAIKTMHELLIFFPHVSVDSLVCYVKTSTINWINNIILTDMNWGLKMKELASFIRMLNCLSTQTANQPIRWQHLRI